MGLGCRETEAVFVTAEPERPSPPARPKRRRKHSGRKTKGAAAAADTNTTCDKGQRGGPHARRKRKRAAAEGVSSSRVAMATPEPSLRSVVVKSFSAPPSKRGETRRRAERRVAKALRLERWTPFSPEPASGCSATTADDHSWSYDFDVYKQDDSYKVTPRDRHSYEDRETDMRCEAWDDPACDDPAWDDPQWDDPSPARVIFRPSWSRGNSQPRSYICVPSYNPGFRHCRDSLNSEGPHRLVTTDRHCRDSLNSEGPHRLVTTDITGLQHFRVAYGTAGHHRDSCGHRRTYQSLRDRGTSRCIVGRCNGHRESGGWEEEEEEECRRRWESRAHTLCHEYI